MIALAQDCLELLDVYHEPEVHAAPNVLFLTLKLDKLRAPTRPHAPGQYFVLKRSELVEDQSIVCWNVEFESNMQIKVLN